MTNVQGYDGYGKPALLTINGKQNFVATLLSYTPAVASVTIMSDAIISKPYTKKSSGLLQVESFTCATNASGAGKAMLDTGDSGNRRWTDIIGGIKEKIE